MSQVTVGVSALAVQDAVSTLGTVKAELPLSASYPFSDGIAALGVKQIFADVRTLAASATEDLDLIGAALKTKLGADLNITKVRGIMILAAAANVNDVVVGGAAANGFISPFGSATDKVKIKPGGCFALFAPDINGYAAVAATADLLRIGNGGAGTSVDYSISIFGS
jgi:hypothetical protein